MQKDANFCERNPELYMYKLLVLDIDDTLAPSGAREVPARNLAAIERAREAGIFVTVSTGRGYFGSSYIWKQLEIRGPVIIYGGATIMDTRTDQPIHTTAIPKELVLELLEQARELGIHAHIYQGDCVIWEKPSAFGKIYCERLGLPNRTDPDIRNREWTDVPKVLFIAEDNQAQELIPKFQAQYAGRLKVSGSSKGFIEFNHPSAHKGSATALLADHLGISQEETVAVGDNSLDTEMIQWAGLGCAVGNALPQIKAVADLVLPACEDMAIEHLIDQVLLKG